MSASADVNSTSILGECSPASVESDLRQEKLSRTRPITSRSLPKHTSQLAHELTEANPNVWAQKPAAVPRHEPIAEDVLFLLLTCLHAERKARGLAGHLLSEFGSLGAILGATHARLTASLPGLDETVALLKNVHRTLVVALREKVEKRVALKNTGDLYDYLLVSLAHEDQEVCRLLWLDTHNTLIRDEVHSRGTVNETMVYPREILRRLLELNASALIIVHNHPSGDPRPSQRDIAQTQQLAWLLSEIGSRLHDHIIVGREHCVSLRSRGFIND